MESCKFCLGWMAYVHLCLTESLTVLLFTSRVLSTFWRKALLILYTTIFTIQIKRFFKQVDPEYLPLLPQLVCALIFSVQFLIKQAPLGASLCRLLKLHYKAFAFISANCCFQLFLLDRVFPLDGSQCLPT